MPPEDLSMVEECYDAVREVLDGATVKDTAIRYWVDRRTLHRWLVRYPTGGLAALADKSTKPHRCPHQMAPEVEARVVELRRTIRVGSPAPSSTSSGATSRRRRARRSIAAS